MNRNYFLVAAFLAATSITAQTVEKTATGVKFSTAQPVLNGEVVFLFSFYCTCGQVSFGRNAGKEKLSCDNDSAGSEYLFRTERGRYGDEDGQYGGDS